VLSQVDLQRSGLRRNLVDDAGYQRNIDHLADTLLNAIQSEGLVDVSIDVSDMK
jgi:hypothetical protein